MNFSNELSKSGPPKRRDMTGQEGHSSLKQIKTGYTFCHYAIFVPLRFPVVAILTPTRHALGFRREVTPSAKPLAVSRVSSANVQTPSPLRGAPLAPSRSRLSSLLAHTPHASSSVSAYSTLTVNRFAPPFALLLRCAAAYSALTYSCGLLVVCAGAVHAFQGMRPSPALEQIKVESKCVTPAD